MLSLQRSSVASFVCSLLLIAIGARGQEYKVYIRHVEKVGDTTPIASEATSSEEIIVTSPGRNPQKTTNTLTASLAGTRTVVSIDTKGHASELSITVSKCTANGSPILGPGTVVVMDRTAPGPAKFTILGMKPPDDIAKALDLMLGQNDPSLPDDDDVYGTAEARRVGDSWPINADEACRIASEGGVAVQKQNVSGKMRLSGIDQSNGKQVLQLTGNVEAKGFKGVAQGGGISIDDGTLEMATKATVAADDGVLPPSIVHSAKFHLTGTAAVQKNVGIEMTFKRDARMNTGAAASPPR